VAHQNFKTAQVCLDPFRLLIYFIKSSHSNLPHLRKILNGVEPGTITMTVTCVKGGKLQLARLNQCLHCQSIGASSSYHSSSYHNTALPDHHHQAASVCAARFIGNGAGTRTSGCPGTHRGRPWRRRQPSCEPPGHPRAPDQRSHARLINALTVFFC
jgi:hypothetical protein